MAEVSEHPKIRRRDKKRKRAQLEELAQKDETDEGSAFYSTQYVNDEEFDDSNLLINESFSQDSSDDGGHEHHQDHDHDHDNGNGLIYKVIFLILLVMLGGISTLVLLENNSAEVESDLEASATKYDQVHNVVNEPKLNQNANNEIEEEETFVGRIASFFESWDNSEPEHGHSAEDDHEHDEGEDHSDEDHGDDQSHDNAHDDHDDDDDDEGHNHNEHVEDQLPRYSEDELRSEINENLASVQHETQNEQTPAQPNDDDDDNNDAIEANNGASETNAEPTDDQPEQSVEKEANDDDQDDNEIDDQNKPYSNNENNANAGEEANANGATGTPTAGAEADRNNDQDPEDDIFNTPEDELLENLL